MNRAFLISTTLLLGCAKLPEDGVDESAADSTELSESAETETGAGDEFGCEDDCVCYPPEFVCVAADREANFDTRCVAISCAAACNAPYCPEDEVGGGECETAHETFTATASQTCIDLLLAAETCHFGLTCAEQMLDKCDPAHVCHEHWLAFRDAGCEISGAPNCE
jgi:hypothetical protein